MRSPRVQLGILALLALALLPQPLTSAQSSLPSRSTPATTTPSKVGRSNQIRQLGNRKTEQEPDNAAKFDPPGKGQFPTS